MPEKTNPQTQKLFHYCSKLPDLAESFLLETGTERAISTRLQYGLELTKFFEYLESYSPIFCDVAPKEITSDMLGEISSQDISRYLTIFKDSGMAERSLARKRAAISSFFTYLVNNKKIEYNPVAAATKVKVHEKDHVEYLNMEEQLQLLETAESGAGLDKRKIKYHGKYEKRDYAIILLFLDTGLRVSELHKLNISDVDFEGNVLYVIRKGGNTQRVFFSDDAGNALRSYYDERLEKENELTGDMPFFVTLKGNRLAIRSIQELVKKYTRAAAVGRPGGLSPHKMRASFAMESYAIDHDLLALQRAMGHSSITTTNIYAKATEKVMEERRNNLAEARAKASEELSSGEK